MRRWLINVAKNETILIVAAILALISCFIVPPDADYKSYIHANTISQLICLMIVVCGFQRIGVFRIIGSRLLEKVSTMRGLVITLVALTFFSSMFITNDVALVMFVPFAVAVLIMAGQEDKTRRVLVIVATPDLPQGGSGDQKPPKERHGLRPILYPAAAAAGLSPDCLTAATSNAIKDQLSAGFIFAHCRSPSPKNDSGVFFTAQLIRGRPQNFAP